MKYACFTIDGGTSSLRFKTKTSDKHCVVVCKHESRQQILTHVCMWDHGCQTSPSLCPLVISVETQIKTLIPTKETQKLR